MSEVKFFFNGVTDISGLLDYFMKNVQNVHLANIALGLGPPRSRTNRVSLLPL